MISKSVLICLLIITISCLQYRNHQLSSHISHEWFGAGQFFRTMQFIGVIVVLLAVGACCFFFRGAIQPTHATQGVAVANNRQNRLEEAPRSRPQPQNYVEPQQAPAENPLLQYFNSQKAPIQAIPTKAAVNPYSDSSNPYITHKEANKHLPQWQNSQILPFSPCHICSQSARAIQRPWAVVDCSDDHAFHLGCLSQNRKKCMTEQAGNGINRCPKCREVYSPVVKVYCGSCVRRSVEINLIDVSDEQGAVSPATVKAKFGVACQQCLDQ